MNVWSDRFLLRGEEEVSRQSDRMQMKPLWSQTSFSARRGETERLFLTFCKTLKYATEHNDQRFSTSGAFQTAVG